MSVAEEQRSEASKGEPDKQNTGRIEEVQGVVIEAVFPDRLPEINHAILVRRPKVRSREEAIDIAAEEDPGSSARCSSTSATTASARSRWTPPTAWPEVSR